MRMMLVLASFGFVLVGPASADYVKDCFPEGLRPLSAPISNIDTAIKYCTALINKTDQIRKYAEKYHNVRPDDNLILSYRGGALFQRARAYRFKGEFDSSISDWNVFIHECGPKKFGQYCGGGAEARAERGVAYYSRGDYARALEDFKEAARSLPESDPWHAEALKRIAELQAKPASRPTAEAAVSASATPGPSSDRAPGENTNAANWNDCIKGAPDASIRACSSIIATGQDRPEDLARAYYNRGTGYTKKDDFEHAVADFDQAIQLNPDYGRAYFNRGIAYDGRDDTKALRDYRMAVQRLAAGDTALRSRASLRVAELEKQLVATGPGPGRRVALVIGNGAYQSVPQLVNPTNDAKLIADALRQDGFDVTAGTDNLSREGLINALKAFATEADNADWAVVYFAGHGIEMGGTNYLIPVDAKLLTDRDVDFEAVPLTQVTSAIEGAHMLRVVILDACRNNPFETTMKRIPSAGRNIGRGLARVEPAQGTVIVFSAKAGTIAADGDGANSPFAAALAQHLTDPGVEVGKLFRLVRDDVLAATGNKQEVFQDSSLPGMDFFFRPQ